MWPACLGEVCGLKINNGIEDKRVGTEHTRYLQGGGRLNSIPSTAVVWFVLYHALRQAMYFLYYDYTTTTANAPAPSGPGSDQSGEVDARQHIFLRLALLLSLLYLINSYHDVGIVDLKGQGLLS